MLQVYPRRTVLVVSTENISQVCEPFPHRHQLRMALQETLSYNAAHVQYMQQLVACTSCIATAATWQLLSTDIHHGAATECSVPDLDASIAPRQHFG